MSTPHYPALYQINTRVWLTELSHRLGRRATLDDIPDAELDRLAAMGFDWIWFLSVWQTGPVGQHVSRTNPEWRREFAETLPDLSDADIGGSGFAITGYDTHCDLGGDAALARLRERLKRRRLRLMLDFVPNHTGIDHPWVNEHPEYYVAGTEFDLARAPKNYLWVRRPQGDLLLAHGRDPYFPGWCDTLQLDYGNPATQDAMIAVLEKIARQCDGVRCDMAMLVLPDVFERTWGRSCELFWPKAIERVRRISPQFCFMAEVYWEREWELQQQGFDYAYDKRLYDRLKEGHARPVREHLLAGLDFQDRLARFLENHDEPRAAATFSQEVHEAAAVVSFFTPGLRFFHQGQFEGRLKRISPHLVRGPNEPVNQSLLAFYRRILEALRRESVRDGQWKLLDALPAWYGNWTSDCLIVCSWEKGPQDRLLVVVNFAPNQSQCRVRLPFSDLAGKAWKLQDLLSSAAYTRDGDALNAEGLFLDLSPWQAQVFSVDAERR
jgi:hypothetical protein